MIYKFNGGAGAILCENCSVIVAEGQKINDLIAAGKLSKYSHVFDNTRVFCCEKCRDEFFNKLKNESIII